ncbi:MAG: nitroreductase family deazaflavin-dependent oxidoreductase [Thermoleophilaceae bacterium]|nr:nitroreductase family deazaflavin-dependent oxidoreductase [Thermoleophilaceae bacterium]
MPSEPTTRLRHVDPARRRGRVYRGYAAFAAGPVGRAFSTKVAWKLDPHLLKLTRGRFGMAFPLPTALLETRGARSGAPRTNALIYFHDGAKVTIIASKLGLDHHPAWYHNLRKNPDVAFGGIPMRAEVVEDRTERHRLWALADRVYPPYEAYRRDAALADREIPIVQLTER